MTFIRTFLRRYESNVETSYRTCNTINATIRREGSRMVDNAEITISGKNDIRIKDYLGYIQDDIDLNGIMGLWNFAGSVRDESGNQLNEENAYNNFAIKDGLTYPEQTSSSKVLGKRSMLFNSGTGSSGTGRFLKIPDKKVKTSSGSDSTTSIVDFSQDFTLAFYVQLASLSGTSTSDPVNGVLFDKYDDSTNKGIMIYTQTPQGSASTVRNLKIRIGNGTTNTIYTHTMTSSDWTNLDKHICVTRTNNVLKVYVENTEVISQTFTGDVTSTADIYLGKEYSETASALIEPSSTGRYGGMQATYHQMRLYNRAWSTSEISTWVGLNAPTISLKFYGRIWRIDERNASNKCYVKGLGSVALNSRIDSSLLTGSPSGGLRVENVYQVGADFTDIIQDMLTVINEKFFGTSNSDIMMINYLHEQKAVGEGYTLRAPYIAEGSFLDILNDLSVLDESTFTFMPTGILQIEENNSLLTRGGLILSNNNCKINDGGIDDSNICNHLFVCGGLDVFSSSSSVSRTHTGWSPPTLFIAAGGSPDVFPIAVTDVTRDGTVIPATNISPTDSGNPSANSYFVDNQTGKLYFYSTTSSALHTYAWSFTYNLNAAKVPSANKTKSISKIFPKTSSDVGWDSIIKNGLYARKLSIPRFAPSLNVVTPHEIDTFAENFVAKNKGDSNNNIQNRYEVKTPSFIGHIIENNKIGIYNLTKGIGSLVSGNIQPEYLQIKSIEYRYPDSQTKLEVGEFLYDSFDLENSLVEDVRSTQSNQF